jgi:hypothetical protein
MMDRRLAGEANAQAAIQLETLSPASLRRYWSLSNAFASAFKELDPIPSIQGDGQAGRVSAGAVLAVVLTYGGLGGRIFPSFRGWSGANHADAAKAWQVRDRSAVFQRSFGSLEPFHIPSVQCSRSNRPAKS